MRYLLATDSVHTTAAACDYLEPHLDPDDVVDVLTVVESTAREPTSGGVLGDSASAGRDAADAANVATARLARTTVETLTREGRPAETIRSVAAERDADVLVIGVHGGRPGADTGLGSVARSVLEACDRPVVVLPLESLDP